MLKRLLPEIALCCFLQLVIYLFFSSSCSTSSITSAKIHTLNLQISACQPTLVESENQASYWRRSKAEQLSKQKELELLIDQNSIQIEEDVNEQSRLNSILTNLDCQTSYWKKFLTDQNVSHTPSFKYIEETCRLHSLGYELNEIKTKTVPPFWIVIGNPEVDQSVSKELHLRGRWDNSETDLVRLLLTKKCGSNKLFVDVGANLGYYSMYASKLGCRVISIEAQPPLIEYIRLSKLLNNIKNEHLRVMNYFISNDRGLQPIMRSKQNWGAGGRGIETVSHEVVGYVEPKSLDEIFPTQQILFLKVDVVGHAQEVMSSAKKLFREKRVENILLTFDPRMWVLQEAVDTINWFLSNGFYIHRSSMFSLVEEEGQPIHGSWTDAAIVLPLVAEYVNRLIESCKERGMCIDHLWIKQKKRTAGRSTAEQ
eukprot:TRINITY_DN7442_c0_g1_i1.p1 TRINITY_DN7442_c0_g1~~TRINITY_DN7442_c0_g1_i1.p1  ORF type:complete len:426 (-),score=70.03 TRINITY_DN7442_c0_g1_i1:752-2029(-)